MKIYMSIMNQKILLLTSDKQIVSYIQDAYACYICKENCTTESLKKIDVDKLLKYNTNVEKKRQWTMLL